MNLEEAMKMDVKIKDMLNTPASQPPNDTIAFDNEILEALREYSPDSPSSIRAAKSLSEIEKSLDNKLQQHAEQIGDALADIAKQQKSQAESQKNISNNLEEESLSRAKDDKKYFWLGALVSFLISMTVEHGAAMIQFLQQLFQ